MTRPARQGSRAARLARAPFRRLARVTIAITSTIALGCSAEAVSPEPYPMPVPAGFPKPLVAANQAVTLEKAELGRYLFYDPRLSANGTQACAACHEQKLAFTDGKPTPIGSTGTPLNRNSQSLANVAYNASLTWANPVLTSIEKQTLVPLFAEAPVELGWTGAAMPVILSRLRSDATYVELFARAYPGEPQPVQLSQVIAAISAFERTLVSGGSRYDKFAYGKDKSALTTEEQAGLELFFSERTECYHCHTGVTFGGSFVSANNPKPFTLFENNGLYNLDSTGRYPGENNGIYEFTKRDSDRGRFRVPSLRNVAVTAPYMHDGSIASLEEVIAHYMAGGRLTGAGTNAGDGRENPNKSAFVRKFELTPVEAKSLAAFLRALMDDDFLKDPRFANPWLPSSGGK
jgi:cytochrome c peroxidase